MDTLDKRILSALARGPQHTSEVAEKLKLKSSTARDHLHDLEHHGDVHSSNDPVFLTSCIRERRIVFGKKLDQCRKQRHPISSFVAKRFLWELTSLGRRHSHSH